MNEHCELIADMLEKIADDPSVCYPAGICYGLSKLMDASGVDFGLSAYVLVSALSGEYTTFYVADDLLPGNDKWYGMRGEFRRAWCRKIAEQVRDWSDERLHEVAEHG